MNFAFFIFGTPNGYNQYPADSDNAIFQDIAKSDTSRSHLTVRRIDRLIYYIYIRQLQEKSSDYFGFCLVFNGVYISNPSNLFELFERAYFDVQLKGEFLKFSKGKLNYVISKFSEKSTEFERISTFFRDNLEYDFVTISPSFKFGNGNKTISIEESERDILSAIAEYEVVHISKDEKSFSELEHAQMMLSGLWDANYSLQGKYKKLLAKKKQYDVIVLLSSIIIVCLVSLFIFSKNILNKDSQIAQLNEEIVCKDTDIDHFESNIKSLKADNKSLRSDLIKLQINVSKLNTEKNRLINTIDQQKSEIYDKDFRISEIESLYNKYAKYEPTKYKVIHKEYYYRYNCNNSFEVNDCSVPLDETITVYKLLNGHGLTEYGWVKMSGLSKY